MENNEKSRVISEDFIINKLAEAKISAYPPKKDSDNFVIPRELTVTITLNEYRDLIRVSEIHNYEKNKLVSEKWEMKLENEIKKLKEENDRLTRRCLAAENAKEEDDNGKA